MFPKNTNIVFDFKIKKQLGGGGKIEKQKPICFRFLFSKKPSTPIDRRYLMWVSGF